MARASLLPLVILFVVIAILAVVGFIVYSIVQEVTNTTREKMEKRNVMFTKDGMTVGVKELKEEDYVDRSQRLVSFSSERETRVKMTTADNEQYPREHVEPLFFPCVQESALEHGWQK